MRRVLGYASRYLMTKNGVLGVGCIGLSLVFALLISSCAPVSHDYIGTWNRQPDKLTYVNYDQHIKLTFPDYEWEVYTEPSNEAMERIWNRPTYADPSYHVMIAYGVFMVQVVIEPVPKKMKLNEYLALSMKSIKHKSKAEIISSEVIERNNRTIGLVSLKAKKKVTLEMTCVVFKEEGRFTILTFSIPEPLFKSWKNQFWAIVDSYEYID